MDKDLVFLIPFHLFRYEKEMKLYGQEKEWLEKLKGNYRKIVRYLSEKVEESRCKGAEQGMAQGIAQGLAALVKTLKPLFA